MEVSARCRPDVGPMSAQWPQGAAARHGGLIQFVQSTGILGA
jgi:hypothetical protein